MEERVGVGGYEEWEGKVVCNTQRKELKVVRAGRPLKIGEKT